MTELLRCPFCGGDKPYVYGPTCNKNTPYNPADRAAPWVVCGQCHAVIHGMDWDESKESAIANWNRRAHLSQPQPVAQGEAGRDFGSAPPRWYTQQEIEHCLQRMSYSEPVIAELAPWFHRHIKSAFDKGYNMALGHATPTIPTGHKIVPVAEVVSDPQSGHRQLVTYFENGTMPAVGTKLYMAPDGGGV